MTLLQALLLSILQGATEFLPVSSSGHLVIAEHLIQSSLAPEGNLLFVVLVHLGTLLAVCVVFRPRLLALTRYAFGGGLRETLRGRLRAAWLDDAQGRLIAAVFVASVPTALIGFLGKDFFEGLFSEPRLVGFALCATAVLLFATARRSRRFHAVETEVPRVGFAQAALLGVVQGFAIIPGVSRSGSTIAVAILIGLTRPAAGEFSFLIFIPAILGAIALQGFDLRDGVAGLPLTTAATAFVAAALSGWVFLKLLLRFVRGGQFAWFGIYCLAVGLWAIFYF